MTGKRHVRFGNILDLTEGVIIHGCNAQGVMGSGIAFQIKQKYPECFTTYSNSLIALARDGINPMGEILPYRVNENLVILNAITQDGFGRDPNKRYVNYEAVYKAFQDAVERCFASGMSLHYPTIGAGLGHGDWAIISDIIEAACSLYPSLDRTLWIYEP